MPTVTLFRKRLKAPPTTTQHEDTESEDSDGQMNMGHEKRQKLNLYKCKQCREARKKCFSADRLWPQKCDRCLVHRPEPLDCSEPVWNTRKRGPILQDKTRDKERAKRKDKIHEPPKPGATGPEDPKLLMKKEDYRQASSCLPPREGDFRILQLAPGKKDDNISCSFVSASVNRPRNYEAVSYHWGAATQRSKETLQSHRTKIPHISNQRKVLRVLIGSKEHIACPDSGSEKNIMSESFASQQNFEIHRGPEDLKEFELGSGKPVRSVGRVQVSVQLPGITLQIAKRWFYVFEKCPVDIILGMEFLQEAEILSKNRHLLESCPAELRNLSSLLWIGSPRDDNSPGSVKNRLRCSMDGRDLVAVADTGSDLNIMSFECAKREQFRIDTREEARTWVQFGDKSKTRTIGQVYVSDLSLDWRTTETPVYQQTLPDLRNGLGNMGDSSSHEEHHDGSFCTVFHVLPGLPCDVIFGRDLLDQLDAFNRCPDLMSSSSGKSDHFELKVLISLGRLASKLRGSKHKQEGNTPLPNTKEAHDAERHSELFHRSQKKEEIALMPAGQQDQARAKEQRRERQWDAAHATCVHCLPV